MAYGTILPMGRLSTYRGWLLAVLFATTLASCDIVAFQAAPTPSAAPIITPVVQTPPETAVPLPPLQSASEQLAYALQQRLLGEYDLMAQALHDLIQDHSDAAEVRAARFYLAESYALRERWSSTVEALRSFVEQGPRDELTARAWFLIARGHEEAGAWADAIAAYDEYRTFDTVLAPYAQLRQAAQYRALNQLEQAAEAYVAVAGSTISRGERAGSYEKAIAIYLELDQADRAFELYTPLLELAQLPDYRARLLGQAATLAAELGNAEQARTWRRELVEQLPASLQAIDALDHLLNDPQSGIAPATAAHVLSLHGRWEASLPHYDAAIAAATGDEALELRRLRALAQRSLGDFEGALAALAAIGAESPNSEPGRQAQLDWVQTRGQSGDIQAAIDGYREYAASYPDEPRAPEALSRVAILLDRLADHEGAAQQRVELGKRYPASSQAHDALYESGWYFYNAGRFAEAQDAWAANSEAGGIITAQSAFWAARAADRTGDAAYRELLERARAAAPDSYYGARATDLLGDRQFGTIAIGDPISVEEWRELETWIAEWSGTAPYHIDEQGYPQEVVENVTVRRAIELEKVDLRSEAIAEWNTARDQWKDDPFKLYALARLAHEHNVPYIALKAAEDVGYRSPDKGFANAPTALRRLIFPTPYSSAVLQHASEQGISPLKVYAMLRQESLFNPNAVSWAGAQGLGQIMPSTAEGIAQNLGVSDYHEGYLLRPALSIRFGSFYLSRQEQAMQGSLHGALAAYNGGLGNAQRWADGTFVADPDIFTEHIDYPETKGYIKLVYGFYDAYQRLYRLP
jgi:soluble lytic murein transglycosylase